MPWRRPGHTFESYRLAHGEAGAVKLSTAGLPATLTGTFKLARRVSVAARARVITVTTPSTLL